MCLICLKVAHKKERMLKLICFITLLIPLYSLSQEITQQSVKSNLEVLGANFPQEKIYIQFDKPAYTAGETIWFKAYLMSGTDPSVISANFYCDIADADGNVLKHIVLPVVESSAKGSFDIPSGYTDKKLHVKAYTRWMLNFDSAFLYDRDIPVVALKPGYQKSAASVAKPFVQFFPEGGDCISGISNKIAFKAVSGSGRPCTITGTIVNSKGQNVAEIKCIHDGMGFFYLEPKTGETYTAKWKDESGTSYQTPLPAVRKEGATLEVRVLPGSRGFLVKRSDNASPVFTQLHLVATMQQQLVYMASIELENTQMTGGAIPVSQLPSGILQLTLFDSNWMAVAERITFINNDNYHFDPEVGFSALGTGKHGKNTLVIDLPDSIQANLSVAVTDQGVGTDSSDNIITRLLLTGDLKGTVYHPAYYFSTNSDSLQQQLDLVMMTNGWRRIKWDELVHGKMPALKYSNDTAYFSLSGKVFGAESDLKQAPLIVLILDHPLDTTRKMVQTLINKDGSFSQPNIILFDTTKIYYSLASSANVSNSTAVTFNSPALPSPPKISFDKNAPLFFTDTAAENRQRYFAEQQSLVAKLMEGTTLQGVTVKAKTKSPIEILDEKYTTGLFTGGQAKEFDISNDPSSSASPDVLSYLRARVAGLMITISGAPGANASVQWRGGTPAFYLDEMPVPVDQLQSLPVQDIGYVKVFEPPFFGPGGGGASGAIAVYTKKGGRTDNSNRPGKGLPFKTIVGYTAEKEFYSPNYGTFDKRNEEPDLRSTLYWNPMILSSKQNHIIRLTFYNNDITDSFRIIVEGVSKDGKITHIEKTIE